jgi:hypothetical protein
MLGRRLISTGIIVLWLVFLFLLSTPIREDISHSYRHLVGSSAELPSLTKAYSLRILGAGNYLSSNKDRFFYLFWAVIWAVPLVILFFTWRIEEALQLNEFLMYSWLIYISLFVFLFVIALYGLLMPFLHL